MADDPSKEEALDRLRKANAWFQQTMMERDEASKARSLCAWEAHKAGASYSEISSVMNVAKTTAIRIVKDGQSEWNDSE